MTAAIIPWTIFGRFVRKFIFSFLKVNLEVFGVADNKSEVKFAKFADGATIRRTRKRKVVDNLSV